MLDILALYLDRFLSPELVVFVISMLPILELRGGLIVASLLGVPWYTAALLSIISNAFTVPFVLLFTKRVITAMSRSRFSVIKQLIGSIHRKGNSAGTRLKRTFPNKLRLGLFVFVAIPLPGTGAWTGSIASALMDLRRGYAMLPICLGVVMSCVIMLVLAYLVPSLFVL